MCSQTSCRNHLRLSPFAYKEAEESLCVSIRGVQAALVPLSAPTPGYSPSLPSSQVIKREGTGTEMPMIGDRVFVHYTGWLLDGTKFDSSLDRKDKFSFDLGKGRRMVTGLVASVLRRI